MQVFIDTNIWLSFYALTSDDIEQLQKLAVLIEDGEIQLRLPQQVIEETRRNRANKIKEALEKFKKHMSHQTIRPIAGITRNTRRSDARRNGSKRHAELVETIQQDIEKHNLGGDLCWNDNGAPAAMAPADSAALSDQSGQGYSQEQKAEALVSTFEAAYPILRGFSNFAQ